MNVIYMLPCEVNFGLDSGDKNHKNQSRTGEPSDLIVTELCFLIILILIMWVFESVK